MLFDDRLATVLRHRAQGELAARTQFRQLLDLLGNAASDADEGLIAAARLRLHALAGMIPASERARLVGDAGARIRSPDLVALLAADEPDIAGAALSRVRLSDAQWQQLIPELPVRARGFLRHRRDLPAGAVVLLDRLGVQDRALPEPATTKREPGVVESPAPAKSSADHSPSDRSSDVSIGALVERIQAYTKARASGETAGDAPRLPLDGEEPGPRKRSVDSFCAGIDVRGRVEIADAGVAPMVVGTDLLGAATGIRSIGSDFAMAFRERQPIREAQIVLAGAPAIAGTWLVDATPRFNRSDGRFLGYAARLRRRVEESAAQRAESAADRIRQLLHELRTPVNAIQGFAEVIQQQIFGTTPHEYRALAAAIAGDAARMLAGFDELDRLARLESHALRLEPGRSDFAAIARAQVDQLQNVLSARVSRFEPQWPDGPATLPVTDDEAQILAWRILATLASTAGAGEALPIEMRVEEETMAMSSTLPASLAAAEDIFATETRPGGGAVSAGIFGAGFALRLARAEARAAAGDLVRVDDRLLLTLPLLTASGVDPSQSREPDRASG
ncbi:sensor histidine kinase [Qipengyuania sp. MTN3-11]|uniref:sensor histidine kinase n=1 Tax=Qipengyuania sp. MTN3-11 TaxID=3056557 RepID=UPI0036F290DE